MAKAMPILAIRGMTIIVDFIAVILHLVRVRKGKLFYAETVLQDAACCAVFNWALETENFLRGCLKNTKMRLTSQFKRLNFKTICTQK
jgi:hypothetical protein